MNAFPAWLLGWVVLPVWSQNAAPVSEEAVARCVLAARSARERPGAPLDRLEADCRRSNGDAGAALDLLRGRLKAAGARGSASAAEELLAPVIRAQAEPGGIDRPFLDSFFEGRRTLPAEVMVSHGPPAQAPAAKTAPVPPGPAALENLTQGQKVAGFAVKTLYTDGSGRPFGARFVHASGMPVDLLFCDSVAQFSFFARTPPPDQRGLPHTLEHLLFGKGAAGKSFNTLTNLRLGGDTALTLHDKTAYQAYSAAPPEGVRQFLEAYLRAGLNPDFTDEEVYNEVAGMVAKEGPDGLLHLGESGTVYNEMVRTYENGSFVNGLQLLAMVLGPDHPLARSQGGEPSAIWNITPEAVRRFHALYYRPANMEMAAAIPSSWSAEKFLNELGAMLDDPSVVPRFRLEPPSPTDVRPIPAFAPIPSAEIRIGSFPSKDPNVPQSALFGWKPIEDFSEDDAVRVGVLLDLLAGGETSYLYKDLVAQGSRRSDAGAVEVAGGINDPSAAFAIVSARLPASALTKETLERVRSVIMERIRWIDGLRPGDADLRELAQKARAAIRSRRVQALKFISDPPGFGQYRRGVALHDLVDLLNKKGGFRQSLALSGIFDALDREVAAGGNPWRAILRRANLLDAPYVSAMKPDAGLLKLQKDEREKRIAAYEKMLMDRYAVSDPQAALQKLKARSDAAAAVIAARDAKMPKPSFVKDPPLVLDPAPYSERLLPSGPLSARVRFDSTPFTQMNVYFDLKKGLSRDDLAFLPILSSALGGLGATTRRGEALDYSKARERWESEIAGFDTGYSVNPRTDRYELAIRASASNPEEIPRAADWLENYIRRPLLGPKSREHLIDLVRSSIQRYRATFQAQEYYWAPGAADAYNFQDKPAYMALNSPFTALYYLDRLRWKLEDPDPKTLSSYEETFSSLESLEPSATQKEAFDSLKTVKGDMGDYLRFQVSHLPPDSWRADLSRVLRETRRDLAQPSSVAIGRLKAILKNALTRSGARVEISGRAGNTLRAEMFLDRVLARLPKEGPPPTNLDGEPAVLEQIRTRYPSVKTSPVNVALINESAKTGTLVYSAKGVDYKRLDQAGLAEYLAQLAFAGTAPHTFYMKNYAAGKAYSSGIHSYPSLGMVRLYADTCPDLVDTLKFMADSVRDTPMDDPFYVEYALANAFLDYAVGTGDYAGRGERIAARLADGLTPGLVKNFKTALIKAARSPEALARLRESAPAQIAKVLPGLGGPGKASQAPGAAGFVIAPRDLVDPLNAFLVKKGEPPLVDVHPRDFWPPERKKERR